MKSGDRWTWVVWTLLLVAGGIVAGRLTARDAAGEVPHEGDREDDHEHAEGALALPAATLANLGVTTGEVATSDWIRALPVAATVTAKPSTDRFLRAPIGGRVEAVSTRLGAVVRPGETLVSVVRDPLPRPELVLTAEILTPAQESLHDSVMDLRRTAQEVEIAGTELARIEQYTGTVGERELPLVPRQRAIDLRYALARAERSHERSRLELEKHGIAEEQIADIEAGAPLPPMNEEVWKRALAHNGLWPAAAERLSAALPERLRGLPWVTATIGELAASGLASEELGTWLEADRDAARHFLALGVLLLRGHTLDDLRRLHALNAFEPIVRVEAPALDATGPGGDAAAEGPSRAPAWDVAAIHVKPGDVVAAGTPLVTLRDPRRLFLRAEPVGGEVAAVLEAARERYPIAARPLVAGAGPALEGLEIAFVESAPEGEGTRAMIEVQNDFLAVERAGALVARTWQLRAGLEYVLRVPLERLEDVIVLPASALAEAGPRSIVFVPDGDAFLPVTVRVLHRDAEVVVLPAGAGGLFPGDRVVRTGAFELALALQGGGGVDPHAGHSH